MLHPWPWVHAEFVDQPCTKLRSLVGGESISVGNFYLGHMVIYVGSHAERQPHIHSIKKSNNENLTCADCLPMIVWLARLSPSSDLFCSAVLIASSFVS